MSDSIPASAEAAANERYESLRPAVETNENAGKILVLDPASDDYEIDERGVDSAYQLLARHPRAAFWAFRIGYESTETIADSLDTSIEIASASAEKLPLSVPVSLRLPNAPDFTLEFTVNAAFTGELALPKTAVLAMRLPLLFAIRIMLADKSTQAVTVHALPVVWGGEVKIARVLAFGDRPIVGKAFFSNDLFV